MNTIHVNASRSYDVLIGAGLMEQLGDRLLEVLKKPCKTVIGSDSNVFPLYG